MGEEEEVSHMISHSERCNKSQLFFCFLLVILLAIYAFNDNRSIDCRPSNSHNNNSIDCDYRFLPNGSMTIIGIVIVLVTNQSKVDLLF